MAPMLFAGKISRGEPIDVYNHGRHSRDFTYIDDIVEGVLRVLDHPSAADPNYDPASSDPGRSSAPFRLFNIGNDAPVQLPRFIELLEQNPGRRPSSVRCRCSRAMWPTPGPMSRTFAASSIGHLRSRKV